MCIKIQKEQMVTEQKENSNCWPDLQSQQVKKFEDLQATTELWSETLNIVIVKDWTTNLEKTLIKDAFVT